VCGNTLNFSNFYKMTDRIWIIACILIIAIIIIGAILTTPIPVNLEVMEVPEGIVVVGKDLSRNTLAAFASEYPYGSGVFEKYLQVGSRRYSQEEVEKLLG